MKLRFAFAVNSVPFTGALVAGDMAVGGSESSMLGLARALVARGHLVDVYASPLAGDVPAVDATGLRWHRLEELAQDNLLAEWDVFVAVRAVGLFLGTRINARLRLLWVHDLLTAASVPAVMAAGSQADRIAYVSAFHRTQWEELAPMLAPLGWVTRNGIDPTLVPQDVAKDPHRIIYCSRPERGLRPLLAMWPLMRQLEPDATLAVCRYTTPVDQAPFFASQPFDAEFDEVQARVGGLVWLGELSKRELYREIAKSAVMWYPGIATFAETSCWTPDTPVAVPGGHRAIRDIKAGELVMSYDEKARRIVAKRVKWCRRTGVNQPVLRLTYKWAMGRSAGRQESIIGTANHQMLRRDGSWTTLGELRPGDSLMPMFRKSDGKYWEVGHTGSRYRYEHDVVGESLIGRPLADGEIVHHKNENGHDNDEANLEVIQQSEHIRRHAPRCPKLVDLDLDRMHALRRDGLSQMAIAREMGTTQATICRRLAESNHRVVSVEPAGFSDVWDMEVEDTHTFIAGHVVAHNCIAALEAMANGTPFVGSFKGALPETAAPAFRHGDLVDGDAMTRHYHAIAIEKVRRLLQGCQGVSRAAADDYERLQEAGRAHVERYTFAAIAAEWETTIEGWFAARAAAAPQRLVEALIHEDDHVAAQVALTDVTLRDDTWRAAWQTCLDVITGRECTPAHYGEFAMETDAELAAIPETGRLRIAAQRFAQAGVHRVLDVGCGNGTFAILLAELLPQVAVVGLDASPQNIARAQAAAAARGLRDRLQFECISVMDLAQQRLTPEWQRFATVCTPFDGLFVGEFLEHVADATSLIDGLEIVLAPEGLVVYTCPAGSYREIAPRGVERHQGHVHRFAPDDLAAVFGQKPQFTCEALGMGQTPRGSGIGHWLLTYRAALDAPPAGERPLAQRIRRTRPHQRLSVGIIAYNAETDLARCLESVWRIADEIVVGDTGSTDGTAEIARRYGATVIELPRVQDFDDGFAGARNAVLDACTGDWFLWIDCDEELVGADQLRKHLDTALYRGLILKQNHVAIDTTMEPDTPCRVFRRVPSIRFFGCIHEQPGDGDANTEIQPALLLTEVSLVHTGQRTEAIRRAKAIDRNLPLLRRDQLRFPHRRLGALLVLRDELVLADLERERARGQLTPAAETGLRRVIALFDEHFKDPSDRFYKDARPLYERALELLAIGFEVYWSIGGRRLADADQTRSGVHQERMLVRSADELEARIQHALKEARAFMHPAPLRVQPVVVTQEAA